MMMARTNALYPTAVLAGLLLSAAHVARAGELIEPTQSLGGAVEQEGRLVVFSEPPGLPATLDGSSLGATPTAIIEVKAGVHHLEVASSKTDVKIDPGQTMQISLYKGSFIRIPVPEQPAVQPPEQRAVPATKAGPAPTTSGEPPSPPALSPIEHKRMFGYY